jgi:hypothetical protein
MVSAQRDSVALKPIISVLSLVYYTLETYWSFGAGAVGNFKLGNPFAET